MNFDKMTVDWFDLLVVIMVLLGARQGRKNGMSVESLVAAQWIAIVLICAVTWKPFGDFVADSTPMSHLFCYIAAYVFTAMVVKIAFSLVKKAFGGKMLGSDLFGRAEFYLGTLAGIVRFTCILITAAALLNARKYSSQEISNNQAYLRDMYGSNFFPELYAIQSQVFQESFCGSNLKNYAPFLLIKETLPEKRALQRRKDDLP